jgi:polysaccharide pyruvyl transferase WcaK-like protein
VRFGLWGTFDLENFGDMLFPAIARRELTRRVPGIEVATWSPIGYVGHNRFEDLEQERAAPLGTWSPDRLVELAREVDVLAIGGGDIVHDRDAGIAPHYGLVPEELIRRQTHRFFCEGLVEQGVPTAWLAVGVPFDPDPDLAQRLRAAVDRFADVSVRDEGSKERLLGAGITCPIEIVPDSAFLAPRLLSADDVERRLARLRDGGWYPRDRGALLVQGSQPLLPWIDTIAEQVGALCRREELTPVLVETGPIHDDGEFADALGERLTDAVRFPAEAGAGDLLAAIAGSAGSVGSSLHGAIVAAAFDRPWLMLDLVEQAKRRGVAASLDAQDRVVADPAAIGAAFGAAVRQGSLASRLADVERSVDLHFDRLAEIAATAPVRERGGPPRAPRPVRALPDPDTRTAVLQSLIADERDRRLIYEAEVADVMARTKEVETWNLELDAGNLDRDRRIAELASGMDALRDRLEHVRFRDWLRATPPVRALRGARGGRRGAP